MASHRSRIIVDTSAISRNVRRLVSLLEGEARLYAVVKADGYGHGAVESGLAALDGGAAGLAVATSEEALELREHDYRGPLIVFGPLFSLEEIEAVAERRVDFTVISEEMIGLLAAAATRGPALNIHLKLDTGMNRQGVKPGAVGRFVRLAEQLQRIQFRGLMTHFACADENLECARAQLDRFLQTISPLTERWPHLLRHAANSAATLRLPESHLDAVRTGIAIYGLSPFQTDPGTDGLEPALRWESVVAAVKSLPRGESAGYGHTFQARTATRLALVPLGYADGLRRGLSNQGEVLIRGRRCRIAGRISMDSFLVDVGETAVRAGDTVTLLGADGNERITAEEMARKLDTINYEITCGLTLRRARRIFVHHSPT
ncbi:MAG: alanine racemase [Thermoleophilia bacterium]